MLIFGVIRLLEEQNKECEDDEEVHIQVIYRLIAEVTKEMNEYSRTVISNKDLKKTI